MPTSRNGEVRTFLRVAELGSFGAAARELGLSPSAVSKQIRALEDRLGVRLVHRTTRRVGLTELGLRYRERARELLDEFDALEAEVRGLQSSPRGTLRVSAPQDFGRLFLCEIVARFIEAYPELRLEFDLTDRLVDLLHDGIDVAVRVARPADSSLVMRRLGTCERVLCASPDYLARHGEPTTLQELEGHDCIEYAYAASPGAWEFRFGRRRRSLVPTGRLRANAGWAMREMVLAGHGIALLPSFLVFDDVKKGDLALVMPEQLDADLAVMALMPSSEPVPAKVRAFVDFLAESLAHQPFMRERLAARP